eukprot:SAG31_NODE_5047_length_2778_cov_3.375887_2_plen_54_part_00
MHRAPSSSEELQQPLHVLLKSLHAALLDGKVNNGVQLYGHHAPIFGIVAGALK